MDIVNRIKLLMEYDTNHTLDENTKIILETIPNWFKGLSRNVVDDVFNNLGGVLKTVGGQTIDNVDDLLRVASKGKGALDDVSKELFRNSVLKNNSITLAQKSSFINTLVQSPVAINKYANKTNQQIFNLFKKAGYPDDVSKTIANKLKPKTATPKPNTNPQSQIDKAREAKLNARRAEQAKISAQQLSDDIHQLEKIVINFENKSAKEVLKNPGLKSNVKSAKKLLSNIKTKDLSVLKASKAADLDRISAIINKADPGLWTRISASISGLSKTGKIIGVITLLWLLGGKNTMKIIMSIKDALGSWFGEAIDEVTGGSNNSTPETTTDDLEEFKQFIKNDWKSDYREGYVSFRKDGNNYIANDSSVNQDFYYIKNNNTFQYVPQQ